MDNITAVNVAIFDINNPTAPGNYVTRFAVPQTPLNWSDDVTGIMRAAVMAYLDQRPTAEQLKVVIAYIQHHISRTVLVGGLALW